VTLKVAKSGAFKACGPLHVAQGGVWKDIARVRVWKVTGSPPVGAWHDVYAAAGPPPPPPPPPVPSPPPPPPVQLTVTISPTEVSGSIIGKGTAYTNVAVTTVSGGTGPYTYTYSRVSYSGSQIPAILVSGTDPRRVQFSRNMQGTVPETQTARFKCIATDSLGNTGQAIVDAWFYTSKEYTGPWVNPGGGGGGAIP
jgi:hypothetical protein